MDVYEFMNKVIDDNIHIGDSKEFIDTLPKRFIDNYCKKDLVKYMEKNKPLLKICDKIDKDIEKEIEKRWIYFMKLSDDHWTTIQLPYPYVVPGGRFNEMYYWDNYFVMLYMKQKNRNKIVAHMLDNYEYLIEQYGFIPNGNKIYYLDRSQPPFFYQMVKMMDMGYNYIDALYTEYDFWMTNRSINVNGVLMNYYGSESRLPRLEAYKEDINCGSAECLNIRGACESGWDFSSRWLNKEGLTITTNILPVDLNCLLYKFEKYLVSLLYEDNRVIKITNQCRKRKEFIEKYMWSGNFYCDYDYVLGKRREDNMNLGGMYPFYLTIAPKKKYKLVKKVLLNKFMCEGGLTSTDIESDHQWDKPNGWAPLQWICAIACDNYDDYNTAKIICNKWTNTVEHVYNKYGLLLEKYNVEDINMVSGGGEYIVQDGFSWTNSVYMLMKNF